MKIDRHFGPLGPMRLLRDLVEPISGQLFQFQRLGRRGLGIQRIPIQVLKWMTFVVVCTPVPIAFGQNTGARAAAVEPTATQNTTPQVTASPETSSEDSSVAQADAASAASVHRSSAGAREVLNRVIYTLAHGPAFDAKVRQRVWTSGREIVGVGTYEQAGAATGRFNLQMTMHDGDGKHTLQQISDGRLAWTRTEISKQVQLKRVDVGRLGEWVQSDSRYGGVQPRLCVGAWTEMLDLIRREYDLQLAAGRLESQAVWIVSGNLREDVRESVLGETARKDWPGLYPTHVRAAIAATPIGDSGFGEGLPVRLEYWSGNGVSHPARVATEDETAGTQSMNDSRMITLVELYSIRPIDPPPVDRFRFDNQDVNFVNETDRYLERYGVHLTESDRRQLRR